MTGLMMARILRRTRFLFAALFTHALLTTIKSGFFCEPLLFLRIATSDIAANYAASRFLPRARRRRRTFLPDGVFARARNPCVVLLFFFFG